MKAMVGGIATSEECSLRKNVVRDAEKRLVPRDRIRYSPSPKLRGTGLVSHVRCRPACPPRPGTALSSHIWLCRASSGCAGRNTWPYPAVYGQVLRPAHQVCPHPTPTWQYLSSIVNTSLSYLSCPSASLSYDTSKQHHRGHEI